MAHIYIQYYAQKENLRYIFLKEILRCVILVLYIHWLILFYGNELSEFHDSLVVQFFHLFL